MGRVLVFAVLLISNAPGCSWIHYRNTSTGQFGGKLQVRWLAPNRFLFVPLKDDPFFFQRSDGRKIEPLTMYTDGGSVPQPLWGVPGYSPWGYAPAYIIHDWIFEAHHCGFQPDAMFSFDESATLIAEGIKTLMESDQAPRSPFIMYSIYEAVKSGIAERLWSDGNCNMPSAAEAPELEGKSQLIMTIDLGR